MTDYTDPNEHFQAFSPKPARRSNIRNRVTDFVRDLDGDGRLADLQRRLLPEIDAGSRDAPIISQEAWDALNAANDESAFLFAFAGNVARIRKDENGRESIQSLDEIRVRHVLCRAARWYKRTERGDNCHESAAMPSMDIIKDMLAVPEIPLPPLRQIVQSPIFSGNGTLKTAPGYHADCRTYYAPGAGFEVPNVAENPNDEAIEWARSLVCDELLGDFPFTGQAEKAHAVALLLQPFARNLIDGPTPLYVVEKPTPGTGATLMVESIAWVFLGAPPGSTTEACNSEGEWRKRITAILADAPSFFFVDNVNDLSSGQLSSALTTPLWKDRELGFSRTIEVEPRCTWVATGNNPTYSAEITRRIARIRLDAQTDLPHLRPKESFKNALPGWAKENRPQLVWAALTLIRAWIAAGKPDGSKTLGMFECWARVMGGILDVAAIPGFLGNLDQLNASSNGEAAAWSSFVGAWWDNHHTKTVGGKDLYPLVARYDIPLDLGENPGEQSRKVRLGELLTRSRDRVFTLETDSGTVRVRLWRSPKQDHRIWKYRLEQLGTTRQSGNLGESR